MTLWAVYTQYYPDYKFESELRSVWTDRAAALTEATKLRLSGHSVGWAWVQEMVADSENLHPETPNVEYIKDPRDGTDTPRKGS
jgi:hypothetical protein